MAEERFKVRPHIRSGISEVDDYLQELEDYLLEFDASNVKGLIIALDDVMGVMKDDVIKISTGDIREPDYTYINDKEKEVTVRGVSKLEILGNDEVMSSVTTMIKMIKDFKDVSKEAAALRPEIEEAKRKAEEKETIKLVEGQNGFEQVQEEKWNKRKTKS